MASITHEANQAPVAPSLTKVVKQRNLWGDAARRFSRNRLSMLALFIIILLVLMALFADVLARKFFE